MESGRRGERQGILYVEHEASLKITGLPSEPIPSEFDFSPSDFSPSDLVLLVLGRILGRGRVSPANTYQSVLFTKE